MALYSIKGRTKIYEEDADVVACLLYSRQYHLFVLIVPLNMAKIVNILPLNRIAILLQEEWCRIGEWCTQASCNLSDASRMCNVGIPALLGTLMPN